MNKIIYIVFLSMLLSPLGFALETNSKAPNFTLTDMSGEKRSLTDYKGKYVVLEWMNHDCPFIKKHYKTGNMQKLQKEFKKKGVVWLSINSSAKGKQGYLTQKTALEVTKEKGAQPTTLLLDPDGKVGKMYGAKTTPHMYIINPDGKLIYQGAIDDKPSFMTGTVEKAKNYVVLALNESMAGKKVTVNTTQPYGCSVKYE